MSPIHFFCCAMIIILSSCETTTQDQRMNKSIVRALIIDGENNHGVWPMTTYMMRDYLESSGLFEVDVVRKKYVWQGPHSDHRHDEAWRHTLLKEYAIPGLDESVTVLEPKADSLFNPDFHKYDVVISTLGWKATNWPEDTKKNFERYMSDGGGLVVIHAADNSFGNWPEYNKMIGIGGWGDRSAEDGPYLYYDDEGQEVKDPSEGICGSHGPQQDLLITNRVNHPITDGLPSTWLHGSDELYDRLRGPAEYVTVLSTAYSDVEKNAPPWDPNAQGSGRHEPVLMAIDYGSGRVFHSTLGHSYYSMESVGFITTFLRGAEWAATGAVTQEVPDDFPDDSEVSVRKWHKKRSTG